MHADGRKGNAKTIFSLNGMGMFSLRYDLKDIYASLHWRRSMLNAMLFQTVADTTIRDPIRLEVRLEGPCLVHRMVHYGQPCWVKGLNSDNIRG